MRKWVWSVVLVSAVVARVSYGDEPVTANVAAPPGAAANDNALAVELADLKTQVAALREQQARLQAKEAADDARDAAAAAEAKRAVQRAVSFSAAPGRGLTLKVGDIFSLSLRPRAQVRDTISIQDGKPTTNEINVKAVRLWIQGNVLSKDLQYGIQLAFGGNEFDKDSSSPIFDAYVEYVRLRDLNIKVGQFFVPFDRARTIREFALQLVDRAQIVSELSLDRDVGLAISSQDFLGTRGILGYHLGIFGGEGKNRFGGAGIGFLYTARIVVRPFGAFDDDLEGDLQRLRKPRLAVGIAGAYNQSTNRQKSTTGNTLTLGTCDYGHAEADLVFKYAGVSLLAEVLYRQARQNGPLTAMVNGAAVTEWSRSAIGYLVQLGVMVHDKVELAARYDDLRALGNTDPTLIALAATTGKELGGGLNVYLNGHAFKIQTDYQYLFGDSIHTGRHAVRLQLDASF